MASETPTCLSCGVCCFSDLPTYARVDGDDYQRLGERAEELTSFIGNRCYMRIHEGHCAALAVDRSTRQLVCTIYESRPAVCRELERGSPACAAEIHSKGERPLMALDSLVRDPRPAGRQ